MLPEAAQRLEFGVQDRGAGAPPDVRQAVPREAFRRRAGLGREWPAGRLDAAEPDEERMGRGERRASVWRSGFPGASSKEFAIRREMALEVRKVPGRDGPGSARVERLEESAFEEERVRLVARGPQPGVWPQPEEPEVLMVAAPEWELEDVPVLVKRQGAAGSECAERAAAFLLREVRRPLREPAQKSQLVVRPTRGRLPSHGRRQARGSLLQQPWIPVARRPHRVLQAQQRGRWIAGHSRFRHGNAGAVFPLHPRQLSWSAFSSP